jgi:hypothetical protein
LGHPASAHENVPSAFDGSSLRTGGIESKIPGCSSGSGPAVGIRAEAFPSRMTASTDDAGRRLPRQKAVCRKPKGDDAAVV